MQELTDSPHEQHGHLVLEDKDLGKEGVSDDDKCQADKHDVVVANLPENKEGYQQEGNI